MWERVKEIVKERIREREISNVIRDREKRMIENILEKENMRGRKREVMREFECVCAPKEERPPLSTSQRGA